jgi:hypothetical protein
VSRGAVVIAWLLDLTIPMLSVLNAVNLISVQSVQVGIFLQALQQYN